MSSQGKCALQVMRAGSTGLQCGASLRQSSSGLAKHLASRHFAEINNILTIRGILSQGGECGASITLSSTQSVGSPYAASLGRRSGPRSGILRGVEAIVEECIVCITVWLQRLLFVSPINVGYMGPRNSLQDGAMRI